MLPASPRAGRSTARRPAQYPSQARSVSRPREWERDREREGPPRALDYESGVAMANRERDRMQRSNTMRQVRPQRSMGNLPSSTRATSSREAQAAPPMPRPFNAPAGPSSNQRPTFRAGSASSDSSNSSLATSSSGSSFLDRMRARNPGTASSQTSLELEQEEIPKEETNGKWYGSRERQVARSAEQAPLEDRTVRTINQATQSQLLTPDSESTSYTTYGYSIWNRIATAAGSIAGNVNEAWAGSNFSSSTEDVPGQETNLTKALKAYYLGKARSRAELPEWLFSDEERRVPSSSTTSRQKQAEDRNYEERQEAQMPDTRRRGFRDAAATAASAAASSSSGRNADTMNTRAVDDSSGYGGSKATNRLRALRDAKRQAALAGRSAQSFSGPPSIASATESSANQIEPYDRRYVADDMDRSRSQFNRPGEAAGERQERQIPKPRMGLPANPRRR